MLLDVRVGGELADSAMTEQTLGTLFDTLAKESPPRAIAEVLTESGWPSAGGSPPAERILAVLDLTREQREDLRDAVRHDLSFSEHIDDPSFRFRFPTLDEPQHSVGKGLLVSLYALMGRRGIGVSGRGVLTRTSWEGELWTANPDLRVCPACLVHRLERNSNGPSKVSLEHYLPKARYSPLVVHPLNMVALCPVCNDRVKGTTDPLHHDSTLNDVWLPYTRPGVGKICVELHHDRPSSERITLHGEDVVSDERTRRFASLYALDERWSDLVPSHHELLIKPLARAMRRGWPEVVETLKDEGHVSPEELRRDPDAFLRAAYARWLLNEEDALQALRDELTSQADELKEQLDD